MDHLLPIELYQAIFEHLQIEDLFTLRLVCKRLRNIVSEFRLNELVFLPSTKILIKDRWHFINRPLNQKYLVNIRTLSLITTTLFNCKTLKLLRISGARQHSVRLCNQLIQLEHLEIDFEIDDETHKSTTDNHTTTLCLPHLKTLYFHSKSPMRIHFRLPSLHTLHLNSSDLDELVFDNPPPIRNLKTIYFHQQLFKFKRLSHLELTYSNDLNVDFLSNLPALEQLCLIHDNHYKLLSILNQRSVLERSDLKVFYYGVEPLDVDHLLRLYTSSPFIPLQNALSFCFENYGRLMSDLWWINKLDYSQLMRTFNTIPTNFFDKFSNIVKLKVSNKVERVDHFAAFLGRCTFLMQLKLNNSELSQPFFDQLPEHIQLTNLDICEDEKKTKLNLKCILKMKYLEQFTTDQEVSADDANPFDLLKESSHLTCVEFKYQSVVVKIRKSTKESNICKVDFGGHRYSLSN